MSHISAREHSTGLTHSSPRSVPPLGDGGRSFSWVDGARRFETWENSYVNIVGLGAAVRQALDIGLDRIGSRSAALGARLRTGGAEIDGVTVHADIPFSGVVDATIFA